jgi:hypothetical protein
VGTDPSVDPGAKTEGRAVRRPTFFRLSFGIGTKALNPSGLGPELLPDGSRSLTDSFGDFLFYSFVVQHMVHVRKNLSRSNNFLRSNM